MDIQRLSKVLSVCAWVSDLNKRFSLADSVIAKSVALRDGNTGLESYKYKRFDQGLWIYSKYLWQPVNLSASEIAIIREACEAR